MLDTMMRKLFGTKQDRDIRAIKPVVAQINALEPKYKTMTDDELKGQTEIFREKLKNGGATVSDILPDAFAVVREASRRVMNMRHFDVQLMGGLTLHQGKIAEMKTGEGKTLTATLPLYLNAISGRGAHLVTVNDYLAQRDSEEMGKLYRWLGLTVGCIVANMDDEESKGRISSRYYFTEQITNSLSIIFATI